MKVCTVELAYTKEKGNTVVVKVPVAYTKAASEDTMQKFVSTIQKATSDFVEGVLQDGPR